MSIESLSRLIVQRTTTLLNKPHLKYFQGAKTGKDNGYTMLFDIESFDYSYYDEGSEGLKVALVHHLDMPIMRQTGFHIAPGTENQVKINFFIDSFICAPYRKLVTFVFDFVQQMPIISNVWWSQASCLTSVH